MASRRRPALVPVERISRSILILRGQRVILDSHLVAIYGVTTGRLNEAVKRNAKRFPEDFMFQLSREEAAGSRSHFAILNAGRGSNVKYRPHAFTGHGVIRLLCLRRQRLDCGKIELLQRPHAIGHYYTQCRIHNSTPIAVSSPDRKP